MRTSVLAAGVLAFALIGCAAKPRPHVEITPYTPPAPENSALAQAMPEGHTAGEFVDVADIRIVGINNAKAPTSTDYLTLHEALKASLCTVAEKDGVNGLAITNRSQQPIFLMVGDLVLGGKQDRIMAESIVVEAGASDETIPVFCVEHGRWSEESGSIEFYARDKSQQADISVKSAAITTSNQSAVWAAVAENNSSLGVTTSTGTFRATFDDPETVAKLDTMYAKAKAAQTADTVGFAVIYKDEVVAMDVFDSKGLCDKLSEKLLRSYLVTAMTHGYEPAPPHPLQQRLEDRVTIKAHEIPLSQIVATINAQWSVAVQLEGSHDPRLTLDLEQATMLDALAQVAAAADIRIYVGVGSVSIDARPATPAEGEVRVTAGVAEPAGVYALARRPGQTAYLDDIQFASDGSGTGNDSGFFFQDTPPSGHVRIDQRARVDELFDRSLGGTREDGRQNRGGMEAEGEPAEQADMEINESTKTERKFGDEGVDYSCTDKKRGSTVHRSYLKR